MMRRDPVGANWSGVCFLGYFFCTSKRSNSPSEGEIKLSAQVANTVNNPKSHMHSHAEHRNEQKVTRSARAKNGFSKLGKKAVNNPNHPMHSHAKHGNEKHTQPNASKTTLPVYSATSSPNSQSGRAYRAGQQSYQLHHAPTKIHCAENLPARFHARFVR